MEVNDKMIDNLANLARLEFNDQEKTDIKKDLEKMIRFVEKLNELDTAGVAPLLHMSANLNILREDVVKGSVSREEGLKIAPSHNERFFLVPKVISRPDNAEINSDQP
ncbi:MAG: Asp-tRNA(Asn)/Glu-tRNA(Gln) amidotransferase subunit GatC [Chitinophagaceae bacterium]|nr:MAG: Asp-tRNA(Asn)/Glu-tRNA(Gln) amidotransferase subunit GatC [Chitinophagaceae bacterium]